MESSILKQIARFLQEQKKQKRWLVVFLCMAVIVGFGTVTALKMRGQAMTHKEKVVICQLDVHQHTDECYDEKKENLICGYADYVVHVHNDDCYDWNGNLTCQLPEVEKHEHSEECYTEEKTLICGLEESAGHQHGAECYTRQQGALICQVPEHTHAAECYDETGAVICGLEEHVHEDACYEWSDVLTCQLAEGADGHTHTDACYEVKNVLTCGKLELHTHTDECYEKINEDEELSETNRRLICTIPVLEEHVHTEEAGCFEIVEVTANGELAGEESTEIGEENEIFTTDLDGEDEEKTDAETEETDGADKASEKTYDETRTYDGDGYAVTVSYNKDANIPEEAELIAVQITEESDAERYAEHEAKAREIVDSEEVSESVLFKIGFYIEEDGEKKEIEPATPVAVTIQFKDEDGTLEGSPITVIHFAEEGNEVLDGSDIEDGSTTFEMESFSYVMLKIRPKEAEDSASEGISVSGDYTHEGDAFDIVFHIEGNASFLAEDNNFKDEAGEDAETSGSEEEAGESAEVPGSGEESGEIKEESESSDESEDSSEMQEGDSTESLESADGSENSGAEAGKGDSENKGLQIDTVELDEESAEYRTFASYVEESGDNSELMQVRVVSYVATYDGRKLDLKDCEITADITPKDSMIDNTEEDGSGNAIEAFEVENNTKVSRVDVASVKDEEKNKNVIRTSRLKGVPLVVAVDADANPKFTVQYYAYLDVLKRGNEAAAEGTSAIQIIDTSNGGTGTNGILPKNAKGMNQKTTQIYVEGVLDDKGYCAQGNLLYDEDVLTPIYREAEFELLSYPELNNFNKFANDESTDDSEKNNHYKLSEVWVLKKGKNPESSDKKDWDSYDPETVEFTNNPNAVEGNKILVKSDTVIRLVAQYVPGTYGNDVAFYDYDITDASTSEKDGKLYTNTSKKDGEKDVAYGINSHMASESGPRFAFGNGNTGVAMRADQIEEKDGKKYNINKANEVKQGASADVYGKCSFGIVQSTLGDDMLPVFNSGIKAPDLFSTEEITGKTRVLEDAKLGFDRKGDTYTFSGVGTENALGSYMSGLDQMMSLQYAWNTKNPMWGNNFWPVDHAKIGESAGGNDWEFGGSPDKYFKGVNIGEQSGEGKFSASDDGQNHNSYFGMTFSVQFELTEDYVGPLDYYFFGDDDMWVYLDDKLVCDIGGCHQAAGEYVNLWDWIKKGDKGSHTLRFFYTERGASGSTCWMQFTLPSVRTVPVGRPTGGIKDTLKISKEVSGMTTTQQFNFTLELKNSFGEVISNKFPYYINGSDGKKYIMTTDGQRREVTGVGSDIGSIGNGDKFTLANGESIEIKKLPSNAKYTIKEDKYDSYFSKIDGIVEADGQSDGTIDWYGKDDASVDYVNVSTYELPKTGGSGLKVYTMAGVLAILSGAGFMYRKKVRERRV